MMDNVPYIITDNSVTVIYNGQQMTATSSHRNWEKLLAAAKSRDWDAFTELFDESVSLAKWSDGKLEIREGSVVWINDDGTEEVLPELLADRIYALYDENAPFEFLRNFWERLRANPSRRVRENLYHFLSYSNIPIGPDGRFYAYKSVRETYKDWHSNQFSNTPGTVLEMPRREVDDDPNHGCSYGFHVGTLEYASQFYGGQNRIVICAVDPADVVSVPHDYSFQKLRTAKYEVVEDYSGPLPSTAVNENLEHASGNVASLSQEMRSIRELADEIIELNDKANDLQSILDSINEVLDELEDVYSDLDSFSDTTVDKSISHELQSQIENIMDEIETKKYMLTNKINAWARTRGYSDISLDDEISEWHPFFEDIDYTDPAYSITRVVWEALIEL